MHFSASRSLTQPLFDCMCILYLTLTQYPYDPGTLPGSADQCILGNVYLRSNLSRKDLQDFQLKLQCIKRQPINTPQYAQQSQNTCECSVLYMMLMQSPTQITLCRHVINGKMYVARPDCKL